MQCTNGVGWFIFLDLTSLQSTQTGLGMAVFIYFIALEHYVNMYIVSLWRESVPMGLNRVSEEGNLTASYECPITYVSLSHTQMDINIIMQERR